MNTGQSGSDRRAAEREDRHQADKAREEEKYRYEMEKIDQEEKDAQALELIQSEEARRQETHETSMKRSEFESERGQVKAGQEDKAYARKEAYDSIKTGVMMQDPDMIREGFLAMTPQGKDVIEYGETDEGSRRVTARPEEGEAPEFIFHPDGYVGVIFPGQEKPVIFENADEAFKNVIAPMNPDKWETKAGTAKDRVTEAKNIKEAEYKDKKLQADIHADAHEAALAQFESDGYYQPALYNEEEYWQAYDSYVEKATGTTPKGEADDAGSPTDKSGKPAQYKGKEAPSGFPGARRGSRGGWYVQKKGKWYPILEGKEQAPGQPSPERPSAPGRKKMPTRTAEGEQDIQKAGVSFPSKGKKAKQEFTPEQRSRIKDVGIRPRKKVSGKGEKEGEGEIYKGTAPPKEYPDAQLDRDEGIWYHFDSDTQKWEKVRI